MDSPRLCTSFSHLASQLVPARNGKCPRRDSLTARHTGKEALIQFHAAPEGQGVLPSQRALPLVETEMLREREGMHLVLLASIGVKYILIPVSLLLPKTEGKKIMEAKQKECLPKICLLQLGEGGQSKDLSPIEREQ